MSLVSLLIWLLDMLSTSFRINIQLVTMVYFSQIPGIREAVLRLRARGREAREEDSVP